MAPSHMYVVVFRNGTKYDHGFVVVKAEHKDMAYTNAIMEYGFMNVGGVYADTEYIREKLRMKGFNPIQK